MIILQKDYEVKEERTDTVPVVEASGLQDQNIQQCHIDVNKNCDKYISL